MKKYILLLLFPFILSLSLQSCLYKKDKSKKCTDNLAKGKVIEKVICKNDTSQSYALYLPPYYTKSKKWPIIYVFDAHARGKMSVKLFKEPAEKYGYIIACSNNSKNGLSWQEINNIIENLFNDTQQRFCIDKTRIYTSGFSGGARIASYIAISKGGINSVIACSAGFPRLNKPIQNEFSFIGITGNEDLNYLEMKNLDKILDKSMIRHQLLIFRGKHSLPPRKTISEAVVWLEVNAMKDKLIPVNDVIIKNIIQNNEKNLKELQAKGKQIKKYYIYKKLINYLDGLYDVSKYKTKLKTLEQSDKFKKALEYQNKIERKESDLQKTYSDAFSSKDIYWWRKEIYNLNKKIKIDRNREEVLSSKRLIHFLSLLAYMNSNYALKTNQLEKAEKFIEIYKKVDPENPEHSYLSACLNARENRFNRALSELESAANLGFNDITRLKNNNLFNSLKNTKKYNEIIQKIDTTK